jgi:hypothetical protein
MNNELVIFNKENTEKQMFTTIDLSKKENKAKLFNASENADVLANDCVGAKFVLRDLYIERIPRINEETGEQEIKYRTILFDEDGKTYVTTAYGIYNTVMKIIAIYGIDYIHTDGLEVEIAKGTTKDKKTRLYLKVIG